MYVLHDIILKFIALLSTIKSWKAIYLSVSPSSFLASRYLSSVSIDQNKTCLKSKHCLWGSRSLILQAYKTHHSSTWVRERLRSRQPLTVKHEAGGLSSTLRFLFQLQHFFIVHHHGTNSKRQLITICITQNGAFQLKI